MNHNLDEVAKLELKRKKLKQKIEEIDNAIMEKLTAYIVFLKNRDDWKSAEELLKEVR